MKKKDPIDILALYTKKIANREKQKEYMKKNPELWLKNLKKKSKEKDKSKEK